MSINILFSTLEGGVNLRTMELATLALWMQIEMLLQWPQLSTFHLDPNSCLHPLESYSTMRWMTLLSHLLSHLVTSHLPPKILWHPTSVLCHPCLQPLCYRYLHQSVPSPSLHHQPIRGWSHNSALVSPMGGSHAFKHDKITRVKNPLVGLCWENTQFYDKVGWEQSRRNDNKLVWYKHMK